MQVTAKENFRRNLRTVIEDRRISQRRLGELAEVSVTFVSEVLTGRACPSVEVAERLANAVEIPLTLLLDDPKKFEETVLQPAA